MVNTKLFHGPGQLVLSEKPSGISKIHLINDFLKKDEADYLLQTLVKEVPWYQHSDDHADNGKYGLQPRLTCWYGALPYSYSGLTHIPNHEWHPLLEQLRCRLKIELNFDSCNSVLCNLYRNNSDKVDWHSDSEPALRKNPFIASISLGATRPFEMKKNVPDETTLSRVTMHLPHGSLLIMEGSTQDDWQHRLPSIDIECGPRINLTFRTIYPE